MGIIKEGFYSKMDDEGEAWLVEACKKKRKRTKKYKKGAYANAAVPFNGQQDESS